MHESVSLEIYRMIDLYAAEESLNALLKSFVEEKLQEGSKWSQIAIYTHSMLGGRSTSVFKHAAVAELAALALDIADDLQDQDNAAKSWITCGREYSLNGILAFLAVCMGECEPHSVKEVGRFIATSVNGQQADLNASLQTEEDYFDMITHKSASLIRMACYLGYSLIPELDESRKHQVDELARLVGIIAQLDNDIRDVRRVDEKNDLLQKKRTFPILYLLQYSEEDFPQLMHYYTGELTREQFLAHKPQCLKFIDQSGCLEYSRVIQSLYRDQADVLFHQLDALSPWKEKFRELTLGPRDIDTNEKEAASV